MPFNSLQYAAFLPVVWIGYRNLASTRKQNTWLLLASYVFYGSWDWRFLSLIVLSTTVDFFVGQRLASAVGSARSRLLAVSLAVNLGLLGVFKYLGFFVDSAADMLTAVGLEPNIALLNIVLPVGISFYTFQTISYTFDIYRRRIEPERDPITFALYVAYFPQLVAGPIERARQLLPQIRGERNRADVDTIWTSLRLILVGLFKKVAIADTVAPLVSKTFDSPQGSVTAAVGILAFSLQIYGDFSGYTDIARGTSRLFGIELVRNFRQPYLSRNITEFWRTWHISLSDWLHDYLYIPLGGNRGPRLRTYRNLMITMLLGGLWHGASWNFVVWGGLHGLYLIVDRALGRVEHRGARRPILLSDSPAILFTFTVVTLTWVFFRAADLSEAIDVKPSRSPGNCDASGNGVEHQSGRSLCSGKSGGFRNIARSCCFPNFLAGRRAPLSPRQEDSLYCRQPGICRCHSPADNDFDRYG